MPHNVQLATATFVLPRALCTSYVETREWVVDLNVYRNGECQGQAAVDVEDSRKRWKLGRALTGEKAEALYQFYRDRRGPTEPFYFYDVFDSDNRFQWDPIGASEVGRFTVRFEGPYSDQLRLGRARAEFGLIEVF